MQQKFNKNLIIWIKVFRIYLHSLNVPATCPYSFQLNSHKQTEIYNNYGTQKK